MAPPLTNALDIGGAFNAEAAPASIFGKVHAPLRAPEQIQLQARCWNGLPSGDISEELRDDHAGAETRHKRYGGREALSLRFVGQKPDDRLRGDRAESLNRIIDAHIAG